MVGVVLAVRGPARQLWPISQHLLVLLLLLLLLLLLCRGTSGQYSSNMCNWKGSGLTHEAHKKDVEQVYLRCSEGSVEWMYPTGALIINLQSNTVSLSNKHLKICIKPFKDSMGANIYLEKNGELKLLIADGDHSPRKVYCFKLDQGALFVEATPQQDISRKITGFQYEVTSKREVSDLHRVSVPCRPCSDTEVLLAVCTSDFGLYPKEIIKMGKGPTWQEYSRFFCGGKELEIYGMSFNWGMDEQALYEYNGILLFHKK